MIFDGYREAMSTKIIEQQRRATQSSSPDIIFELDLTVSTHQNRFLANRRNTSRFIGHTMTKLKMLGSYVASVPQVLII